MKEGLYALLFRTPAFEMAWIFFSVTICILLLSKREGAQQTVWLLPIIILVFAVNNYLFTKPSMPSPDEALFPTEEMLIKDYLSAPLSPSILEQKKQLEEGWKRYLIDQWTSAKVKNLESHHQFEEAEFNFTVQRLKLLHFQSQAEWLGNFPKKSNLALLFLYFFWNIFFAWAVYTKKQTFQKRLL